MSTTLQEPPQAATARPGERLRTTMAAVRLSFHWFGTRKSLSAEQKSQAAQSFGAEGRYLSAGKKLLDTRHPAYKAVTAVRGRAVSFWKGVSLPYPESGIRLIRQDGINAFDNRMQQFREELDEAVRQLDRQLNVGSHDELDRLVDQAQQIVRGVQPQQLRDNGGLRQQVAEQLGQVQTVLDDLLVDRPRRNIVRSKPQQEDG